MLKKFFAITVVSIALTFSGLQNMYAVQSRTTQLKEICLKSMGDFLLSLAGNINSENQKEIFYGIVQQAGRDSKLKGAPGWTDVMVYDDSDFSGDAEEQFTECLAILFKRLQEQEWL